MLNTQKYHLNKLLGRLSEALDISETRYNEAKERFQSVGKWLEREESIVSKYAPIIYPQGSFLLGTVVQPISNKEEYDIDLVCELNLDKSQITQKQLKQQVGNEIKKYSEAQNMKSSPEEGRRCWTLNYAGGAQFHMDILPALPDENFKHELQLHSLPEQFRDQAIAITDNTSSNYYQLDKNWPKSNPKGYAAWFKKRMEVQFNVQKQLLAEAEQTKVEEVPEYKVKTPLQIAVQLLKRHRDIRFFYDNKDKPISIIITTLAAKSYNNEPNIVEALNNIIQDMPNHIQMFDGVPWVANPVNPEENFADKWQEHPQRKAKFENWLNQVQSDFNKILEEDDLTSLSEYLKPKFGEQVVNEALNLHSEKNYFQKPKSKGIASYIANLKDLFHVTHREKPKWEMNIKGKANITAYASRNGFRPWEIKSDSKPLSKHCSLRFHANTNIAKPYKVYWQVVNTGAEASAANCLRGGYYEGIAEKGGLVRKESTLYTGTHWVECFIIKNDECVARSREFVININ